MPRKPQPVKRPKGRPRKPPEEHVRRVHVSLDPPTLAYVTSRGEGEPARGIRRLIDAAMHRLESIDAAMRRRD